MSHRYVTIEDDDYRSTSSLINSDADTDESYCHTHRSCGRNRSCNRNKHQHSSKDFIRSNGLSKSNLVKGDIRSAPNEPGHQQKYDGTRWRRICSSPGCSLYLNGGVYFENWLCRKHYLVTITPDTYSESDSIIVNKKENRKSPEKNSKKSLPHQSNDKNGHYKRGDIIRNPDGSHQKYNGKIWRAVCSHDQCISYVVAHGYCHRHDLEMRKKTSAVLSSLSNPPTSSSKSNSYIQRPTKLTIEKVRKGDIQFVRQQWNGTKWYSLCHYHTRDCTRRSAGMKYAHLCENHFKEYKQKQNDESLIDHNDDVPLSPKLKRKKLMSDDYHPPSNDTGTPVSIDLSRANSTTDQTKQNEQCIQTDLTYPLDSVDLREGCFLVDDDSSNPCQPQSQQTITSVKKEEDNFVNNKRKVAIDPNSLPLNCKIELIKIEL